MSHKQMVWSFLSHPDLAYPDPFDARTICVQLPRICFLRRMRCVFSRSLWRAFCSERSLNYQFGSASAERNEGYFVASRRSAHRH